LVPHFRSRLLFWPGSLLTIFFILFLWLPAVELYGTTLLRVVWHQPGRLLEALPLQPLQRFLFLNTLGLCVLTAGLAVTFGVPVGAASARGPQNRRNVFTVLSVLPLALPPMLAASAWLEITRTPPARSMASLAATTASPLPPVPVASLVLALCFFPVVALWVRAALMNISPATEEAALSLGGPWQMWRRVLFPLLWPAIAGAAGIVCALTMWEMGAPDLLDARTYSVEIYRQLNAGDNLDVAGKYSKVALEGVPMLFLGALALWPAARALSRFPNAAVPDVVPSHASTRSDNRVLAVVAILVLLASPCAVLAVFGSQLRPVSTLWESWGSNDVEIYNTMRMATLGALFITVAALAMTLAWQQWRVRLRNRALWLCVAPLLVAPILLGVSLINFWNRPPLWIVYGDWPSSGIVALDTLRDWVARDGMMLIGYAARYSPLAILLLYEAVRRLDRAQIEAAQNLGATSPHITAYDYPAAAGTGRRWRLMLCYGRCAAANCRPQFSVNQPGGTNAAGAHIQSDAHRLDRRSGRAVAHAVLAVRRRPAAGRHNYALLPATPFKMTPNWNTLDEQWKQRHDAAQFTDYEAGARQSLCTTDAARLRDAVALGAHVAFSRHAEPCKGDNAPRGATMQRRRKRKRFALAAQPRRGDVLVRRQHH
jgi:ABC-type Fe3+ transport system permease subunit